MIGQSNQHIHAERVSDLTERLDTALDLVRRELSTQGADTAALARSGLVLVAVKAALATTWDDKGNFHHDRDLLRIWNMTALSGPSQGQPFREALAAAEAALDPVPPALAAE